MGIEAQHAELAYQRVALDMRLFPDVKARLLETYSLEARLFRYLEEQIGDN